TITNAPQPYTAVLFHWCSKTVLGHSTSPRRRCSWDGQEMPSVPPASEETSLTSGIISTPIASPARPSQQPQRNSTRALDDNSPPPAVRCSSKPRLSHRTLATQVHNSGVPLLRMCA